MRSSLRHALAPLLLLLAPALARGAAPPEHRVTGDLAIRARDIFLRHCAKCHTGSIEPGESKLKLMDHTQVVAKKPVPLATPNGRSLILDLVKDGSMPPANQPGLTDDEVAVLEKWVKAKTPEYPLAFDERTTLSAIADDFEGIVAKGKDGRPVEYVRYISFAHLVRDGQPPPDIAAAEELLRTILSDIGKIPPAVLPQIVLEPVDPAATLFRFDTRLLGGEGREVFDAMEGRKVGVPVRLQPFDLILMEYPHAQTLAAKDPLAARLEKALASWSQVRPVPFVRGDWLAEALRSEKRLTPLAEDIKALAELEKVLARKGAEPDGPTAKPFVGAKPVSVPAPAEGRTPIPPLSAWYAGDVTPAKAPFELKAELVVSGNAVAQVKVDEAFTLRVVSDRKVFFTLLMVQADGEIRVQPVQGGTVLQPNRERLLSPNGTSFAISGILGGGDAATEYFVLFASETELPLPKILRSKHADKHVWRFLLNPTAKEPFDPNAVVRKLIPIKVTRK